MTTNQQPNFPPISKPNEQGSLAIRGHIKIFDPVTKEVFIDKPNAIHYENFSIALAQTVSGQSNFVGMIEGMALGNGGTRVDNTGIITYLTPNVIGSTSNLYNQTYFKTVAPNVGNINSNTNPAQNYMQVRHLVGSYYSDVLISMLLDFGEPNTQQAFDNEVNSDGTFVFDELGIRAYLPGETAPGQGPLLTHVIFHPVQKSLNRTIQIDYTIRIQSLTAGA
jgi:hypothetical protein